MRLLYLPWSSPPTPSARFPLGNPIVLGTSACDRIARELNAFENGIFGPDFACDDTAVAHWREANSVFTAAVVHSGHARDLTVHAVASVVLTSTYWRDRLILGDLADYELGPWSEEHPWGEPVFYLASIYSEAPEHLIRVYASLEEEMRRFLAARHLEVTSAFSIAAGSAGLRHLTRGGFRPIPDAYYRQKYPILEIDRRTARSPLWCGVLTPHRACSAVA